MAVVVFANANRAAARHVDTRHAVRKERDGVTRRATKNLEATKHTPRIDDDGYFKAFIDESEEIENDHELCYTTLVAPNAVALEFGHAPSGKFAGTDTKAPEATYILTRAAISGVVS